MQQKSILACYSRSLNKYQIDYTTVELGPLSIVSLLREYRTLLLGFDVIVHTNHKSLVYPTDTNLDGAKNIRADVFSRMKFESEQQQTLDEEIYAETDEPECVMHGPVIRDHQDKDTMVQKIKSACPTGTSNPDNKLMSLLGC
ncbi:hypothetical protein PC128_g15733 [Phytophthora cactorum]|nr:hypothetical protein PC128_g15733 [Phytophthora cactorum]